MSNLCRLKWLDIAKGIAIILMVIGHTSIPNTLSKFIFAFHMPLFFIASGWTTNWEKLDIVDFIKRRLRTIMMPFACYSAIVLSIQLVTVGGGKFLNWLVNGWQGYALWFVPVLFVASVLGRLVHAACNVYFRYTIMAGLVLIGAYLRYIDLYLPWSLSSVPYACFFILLGTELKGIQKIIIKHRLSLLIWCFALTCLATLFGKLDMAWNAVLPVVPLIIGAISGTLMTFVLCSYIEKNTGFLSNLLSKIGRETFVIVAFSQEIIILLHDYTSLHSIICYLILIVSLTVIVLLKNQLKGCSKT